MVDGSRTDELRAAERGAAIVIQSYAPYLRMTVVQNMGLALKMDGVRRAQREEPVVRVADILRIPGLLGHKAKELSGG
jgi:ABC-type sugar transport system ATPase subunit